MKTINLDSLAAVTGGANVGGAITSILSRATYGQAAQLYQMPGIYGHKFPRLAARYGK